MYNSRTIRRMAGFLNARLSELGLAQVLDPRNKRGRKWKIDQLLRAMLVGLLADAKSLAEIEDLTAEMSQSMRKLLKIPRRTPDTTLRDWLCGMNIDALRAVLHQLSAVAQRRKAIAPVGLPFGVITMDGKATAIKAWDDAHAQRHLNEEINHVYGLARTVTVSLTSALAKPCIDVLPIPAATNEMGFFPVAFASVCDVHSKLFSMVTYDAGAASEANGALVVAANKHYLFRLKNETHHMFQYVRDDLLSKAPVLAQTTDILSDKSSVTRTVRLAKVDYIEGSKLVWDHTRAVLCVTSTTKDKHGVVTAHDERYFASSLPINELSAEQWLLVVRSHWAVENNAHHTLDTAFEEDAHPFIEYDPKGMIAVAVLRRIAYTLLALFRSVTLRSEDNKKTPWADLMRWIYNTVISATEQHIANLRLREEIDASVFV